MNLLYLLAVAVAVAVVAAVAVAAHQTHRLTSPRGTTLAVAMLEWRAGGARCRDQAAQQEGGGMVS